MRVHVQQNFKTANVEGSFRLVTKRKGLRVEWNPTGSVLVIEGESLIQICGPTTSIDLPSTVARRADDLTREPWLLIWALAEYVHCELKGGYDGAWPRRDLKTSKDILYKMI